MKTTTTTIKQGKNDNQAVIQRACVCSCLKYYWFHIECFILYCQRVVCFESMSLVQMDRPVCIVFFFSHECLFIVLCDMCENGKGLNGFFLNLCKIVIDKKEPSIPLPFSHISYSTMNKHSCKRNLNGFHSRCELNSILSYGNWDFKGNRFKARC